MQIINYFSDLIMPFLIVIIIITGVFEKKNVFDFFVKGVKEGVEIVIKIFPTLVGLFVAISVLRGSGVIDLIIKLLEPLFQLIKCPMQILPLAFVRPISGSASIAVATDIIEKFGVDSNIGIITAVIMGSTETTLYTIAVYSSAVGIKNTRFTLWAALIADVVGMAVSVVICQYLSKFSC